MDTRKLIVVGLCAMGAAVGIAQEEETWEGSVPRVIALSFVKSGDSSSATLEKTLAAIQGKYEDKDVLFVKVETATRGGRHQAKMLLNSLGVEREIGTTGFKSPGTFVLVDADTGGVATRLDSKKDAKAISEALDRLLAPKKEMDDDEEDSDDEGCDDGDDG